MKAEVEKGTKQRGREKPERNTRCRTGTQNRAQLWRGEVDQKHAVKGMKNINLIERNAN